MRANGFDSLLEQLRSIEKGHFPRSLLFPKQTGPALPLNTKQKSSGSDDIAVKRIPSQTGKEQRGQVQIWETGKQSVGKTEKSQQRLLSSSSLQMLLQPQDPPAPRSDTLQDQQMGTLKPDFVTHHSNAHALRGKLTSVSQDLREQERLTLSLRHKYSQLKSNSSVQEKKVDATMHFAAIDFLPTELLIKHKKFEYVKERALNTMYELLVRGQRRALWAVMRQWARFVALERDIVAKEAGATIVRIARGHLGRLRARKIKLSLDVAANKAAKVAAVRTFGAHKTALIIQCSARRMLAYRRVSPMLHRHRSVLRLQLFFRSRLIFIHAKNKITCMRRETRAAVLIQKTARAMLGRRRFHRYWLARRQRSIQRNFDTTEGTFRYYFEQAGAAAGIQRWWRKLPVVIKGAWRRLFLEYYTHRKALWECDPGGKVKKKSRKKKKKRPKIVQNAAYAALANRNMSKVEKRLGIATLINPIVRGFLGRRRVRRIILSNRLRFVQHTTNATRLQAYVRRYLVAQRLPLVGLRSRALMHKTRRWVNAIKPWLQEGEQAKMSKVAIAVRFEQDAEWRELYPKPCLARRGGLSYTNIKIPNAATVARMHVAALRISNAFRRCKARRIILSMRQQRHVFVASRMIRWARTCIARLRVLRFRALLTPMFARCKERNTAAKCIQGRWKTYAAMAWFHRLRRGRRVGIFRLQRFARRIIIARGRRKTALHNRRSEFETVNAGAEQYKKTQVFTYIDFIWQGAKKTRTLDVPHDMQKFFASQGGGGQVDTSRVSKIAKDAGILGKDLDVKTLEMQFMKVKAPAEKRMGYSYWLELLANIGAIKFLEINPSLLKGASNEECEQGIAKARGGGEDSLLTPEQVDMNRKIKAFRFGRYSGRTALIMKVTYTYLIHLPEWKKAANALGKKAAPIMSSKHVVSCVGKAQAFVRNRLAIKHIDAKWRQWKAVKLRRRMDKFATRIETMVRSFLGKRHIMRMAQSLYNKYVDEETGAIYWFNPRTSNAFWTKPKLLGKFDCGVPIRMPHPDDQYVVICGSCAENSASTYCDECDFAYCLSCFHTAHRGGRRQGHTQIPLLMCVQCDFQVGTKECVQCQDLFCESCYKNVHGKGRLRLHICNWATDACEECGVRAAQWTQHNMRNISGMFHWCVYCFRDNFNTEPQVTDENGVCLKKYNFQGRAVRDFRGQREAMRQKRLVAADYAERLAGTAVLKTNRAATNVQRTFRGFLDRKHFAGFIADRRAFYELRAEQRPYRANPIYKFLEFWGIAPNLRSDTMLERVKKQYPAHMQSILQECLRDQWKEACRLQREQEEHLQRVGNPGKVINTSQ